MDKFPQKTDSVSAAKRTRTGMTLVEVMLGAAILAILAALATTALVYPRLLVVNSGREQSAIHAATAEIERHLHNHLAPADPGIFNTDGWIIQNTNIPPLVATNETIPGTSGDTCEYLPIHVTIDYRDGKTVELVTYRSLEVSSSER